MIGPGQKTRTRWRTQRGGVYVVVTQPISCESIEIGRGDRAAGATYVPVAGVIEYEEGHVWRPFPRSHRSWPCGFRDVKGAADHTGKGLAGFVFLQRCLCIRWAGSPGDDR